MHESRLILGQSEALRKAEFFSKTYRCIYFVYFNLAGWHCIDSQAGSYSGEILLASFVNGKRIEL